MSSLNIIKAPENFSKKAIDQYFQSEERRENSCWSRIGKQFLLIQDNQKIICCSYWQLLSYRHMPRYNTNLIEVLSFCTQRSIFDRRFPMLWLRALKNRALTSSKAVQVYQCLKNLLLLCNPIRPFRQKDPLQTIENVIFRYEDLIEISRLCKFETATALAQNPETALKIALFIETKIKHMEGVASQVFKQKETKLARTLQYDSLTRTVYIFAKRKISLVQGSGSTKKAISVVGIQLDRYRECSFRVRLYTKLNIETQNLGVAKYDFQCVKTFSMLAPEFFLRQHAYQEYMLQAIPRKTKNVQQRISCIVDAGLMDFKQLFKKYDTTIEVKSQFIKDIISGIYIMHQNKCIHSDMKPANCVVVEESNMRRAKIIDFGYVRQVTKNQPLGNYPGVYDKGYYGSGWWTAPELLMRRNFAGDHFGVEMFAIGAVIWELVFCKEPSWFQTINRVYGGRDKNKYSNQFIEDCQRWFNNVIIQEIEIELMRLMRGSCRTNIDLWVKTCSVEKRQKILLYNLLRLNPAERWSAKEAKAFCDQFL